jgi:hypothetical protein
LPKELRDEVTLHEAVHFVIFNAGMDKTNCEHEELARRVSRKLLGLEYNDNWKGTYGCREEEEVVSQQDRVVGPVDGSERID